MNHPQQSKPEPLQGQLKTWCGPIEDLWKFIAKFSKRDAVDEPRTYYVYETIDPDLYVWTRHELTVRRTSTFCLTLTEQRAFHLGRPVNTLENQHVESL